MYRVGTHARSHMRARVWPASPLLCLLAFTQTARAFSRTRSTSRRERALTPHCRRVSLALRISSECTVDVCAEINAAAPPDQQRFPVSCEVTGLRREKRCRLVTDRVPVSPCSLRLRAEGDEFLAAEPRCFSLR